METRLSLSRGLRVLCLAIVITAASLAEVPKGFTDSDETSVKELQISVLPQATNESESSPQFRVELRNVGDHDLILNLGMMLANGKRLYAHAITLLLSFPSGSEQRLVLMGPAIVAGRADPFVVPLPVGASFSIPVDLTKYAPFGRDPLTLEPGTYSLQAEFQGKPGVNPNLDMKGMALMPYWAGTVVSTKIEFRIAR